MASDKQRLDSMDSYVLGDGVNSFKSQKQELEVPDCATVVV